MPTRAGRRRTKGSAAKTTPLQPVVQSDVERLFASLGVMSRALTGECHDVSLLDGEMFDEVVDHLVMVRPASHLGRYKFEFCGSTIAETSYCGDVAGLSFGDILSDVMTPSVLAPYAHVSRVRSPNVTRGRLLGDAKQRTFTRYILPLFHGDRIAILLSALVFHPQPLDGSPRPGLG